MANPFTTTAIKKHVNALVTNGAIYTNASSSDSNLVTAMMLHNTSTSNVTVEIWLVPSGGSTSVTNKFYKKTLIPDQTYILENLPIILAPGDFISATAGTASVVSLFLFGSSIAPVS